MLIFLEAEASGRPAPVFAAHLQEALLAAAVALGLRSLEVRLEALSHRMGAGHMALYHLGSVHPKLALELLLLLRLEGVLQG